MGSKSSDDMIWERREKKFMTPWVVANRSGRTGISWWGFRGEGGVVKEREPMIQLRGANWVLPMTEFTKSCLSCEWKI